MKNQAPETRRIRAPREERSRWFTDLEAVALALTPERWPELRGHLSDSLRPGAKPGSMRDRGRRLSELAHLVRSGGSRPLSRAELRFLCWRPPHLALLRPGA